MSIDSVFSLSALESKLVAYVKEGDAASQPFDISSVPKMSREQAAQEVARALPGFAIDSSSHS
jgi:coatomer protein complex subunit gamma